MRLPEELTRAPRMEPARAEVASLDTFRAQKAATAAARAASLSLPMMGRIAAGTPIEAMRTPSEMVEVPADLLTGGEHYALEVAGDDITVNAIAPGMILTPMNQAAKDHWTVRKVKSEFIPLKRPGQPEEVANVAVFLASGKAGYMTSTTVVIDGGIMQGSVGL